LCKKLSLTIIFICLVLTIFAACKGNGNQSEVAELPEWIAPEMVLTRYDSAKISAVVFNGHTTTTPLIYCRTYLL
jgi:hypothetical protein